LSGAQLRYFVASMDSSSPCWALAPPLENCAPDEFIGWTDAQRRHNMHRIVNNARFLILLGALQRIASKILGASPALPRIGRALRLPPALLETFVQSDRFRALLQGANWIHVGQTPAAASSM